MKAKYDMYESYPAFRDEFHKNGVELMMSHPTEPGVVGISKRKTGKSPADIRGPLVAPSIQEVAWFFGPIGQGV
jgi:hypothetical protein